MIHDLIHALLVFAVIAAIVYLRMRKHHRPEPGPPLLTSREAELEDEVAELRRRIAVLERIATEDRRGRDIAAEIEALRDRV